MSEKIGNNGRVIVEDFCVPATAWHIIEKSNGSWPLRRDDVEDGLLFLLPALFVCICDVISGAGWESI